MTHTTKKHLSKKDLEDAYVVITPENSLMPGLPFAVELYNGSFPADPSRIKASISGRSFTADAVNFQRTTAVFTLPRDVAVEEDKNLILDIGSNDKLSVPVTVRKTIQWSIERTSTEQAQLRIEVLGSRSPEWVSMCSRSGKPVFETGVINCVQSVRGHEGNIALVPVATKADEDDLWVGLGNIFHNLRERASQAREQFSERVLALHRPIITDFWPKQVFPGSPLVVTFSTPSEYKPYTRVIMAGQPCDLIAVGEGYLIAWVPESVRDYADFYLESGLVESEPQLISVLPRVVIHPQESNSLVRRVEVLGTRDPVRLVAVYKSGALPNLLDIYYERNTVFFDGKASETLWAMDFEGQVPPIFIEDKDTLFSEAGTLESRSYIIDLVRITVRKKVGGRLKKVDEYYFWRNGKWYKIKDPNRRWKKDKRIIELGELPGTGPKNYEEADEKTQRKLNKYFFPTGWEKFWEGFSRRSRAQLQFLLILTLKMTGGDPELVRLIIKIVEERKKGASWDEIFDRHGDELLVALLVATALGLLFKAIGKLITALIRSRKDLVRKLVGKVKVKGNKVSIAIKDKYKDPKKLGKLVKKYRKPLRKPLLEGLDYSMTGTIEEGKLLRYSLYNDRTFKIPEQLQKQCLGTAILAEMIRKIIKFAQRRGLKKILIKRSATSDAAVSVLERLGFEREGISPLGEWKLEIDLTKKPIKWRPNTSHRHVP